MRVLVFLMCVLVLSGCALPERLHAVPASAMPEAAIMGMTGIRYFTYENPETMKEIGRQAFAREIAWRKAQGLPIDQLPPASFLAISGGGDNGAFGAGLLLGWTDAGTRPEFKLVTGISTGALIAPFAFLGPDYDPILREVYTTIGPKDVAEARNLLAALFHDAMADNAPLQALIAKHVDANLLERIAAEYSKGRMLLIGTTNLDAQRGVMWDLGAIASSGHPNAVDLVRKILTASSAIPGAFPPVLFDAEAEGHGYQELHVDGGAIAQVFAYPSAIELGKACANIGACRDRHLYIIRNARLDPAWAETERRTLSIAGRAIASMIQTQGIGDLYRIFLTAKRDGVDYNLAFIPASFDHPHAEEFDTTYMNALFDLAYDTARNGFPWQKLPPGYVE